MFMTRDRIAIQRHNLTAQRSNSRQSAVTTRWTETACTTLTTTPAGNRLPRNPLKYISKIISRYGGAKGSRTPDLLHAMGEVDL
jgi:hypothetical protein